uniref:Uncharacterized protein n=1 Tax=Clytia hemisphaerica TaxID=252671 RepID=A0A7M5WKT7_9CNID
MELVGKQEGSEEPCSIYLVAFCLFSIWLVFAIIALLAPPLCCQWKQNGQQEEEEEGSTWKNNERLVKFSDSSFEQKERTFSTITKQSDDMDTSQFEISYNT